MNIINICRVNYQYQKTTDEPYIHSVVYSNPVQTIFLDKRIKALKVVDKLNAVFFEVLTYTLIVENISNHSISCCYLKDCLSHAAVFKQGSVRVEGNPLYFANPLEGMYLEKIEAHTSLTITYQAVITYSSSDSMVRNMAQLSYPHVYHIEKPGVSVTEETNETLTKITSDKVSFFLQQDFFLAPSSLIFRLMAMQTCILRQSFTKTSYPCCDLLTVKAVIQYNLTFQMTQRNCSSSSINKTFSLSRIYYLNKSIQIRQNECLDLTRYRLYFCEGTSYQAGLFGVRGMFKFLIAKLSNKDD